MTDKERLSELIKAWEAVENSRLGYINPDIGVIDIAGDSVVEFLELIDKTKEYLKTSKDGN